MPIFASSGAFLKPGETENKRTIQTEVNSYGSMLIIVVTPCQEKKSEKRAHISNKGEQIAFGLMQLEKSMLKLLKHTDETSYVDLIGQWSMM